MYSYLSGLCVGEIELVLFPKGMICEQRINYCTASRCVLKYQNISLEAKRDSAGINISFSFSLDIILIFYLTA